MRFGLDYMLRLLHETSVAFDSDLLSGLIFLALVRANGQHLAELAQLGFSSRAGVIPDAERRPASVQSVADSLGLPYETVRRRLQKLCLDGWCRRTRGGYVIPEEVLLRSSNLAIMSRNLGSFQLMLARAHRAGLTLSEVIAG